MKRNHDVTEEVNDSSDVELLIGLYIMPICALIVISVIALIVMLLGLHKVPTPDKRYTYNTAILIDTEEQSYQSVDKHSGRIGTYYEYVRTFEYTDDIGETHRFTITMQDSDSSKYQELDIRYKDNNQDILQFNIGQLQDQYGWVSYKR